jgi:hypothetical protein
MIIHHKRITFRLANNGTYGVRPLVIGMALVINTVFSLFARTEDFVQRVIVPTRIQSWVAEPFMNQGEEQAIWTWLRGRPRCFKKIEAMRDLSNSFPSPHPDQAYFPIFVNADALEEIGIDVDRGVKQASAEGNYPVGTELSVILERNDLTFLVRNGRLEITTKEDAESKLTTRLYDVTPILSIQRLGRKSTVSFHALTETIYTAVRPDSWEMLGGQSTITSSIINNRCLLVVSAPTLVHMDVQHLLDQLAIAGRLPVTRSQVPTYHAAPRTERAAPLRSIPRTDSIPTSVW